MGVRWSTLVADGDGAIDYARVRSLVSVLLALLGGAVIVAAMAFEVAGHEFGNQAMLLGAGALILPITGGKIADGLAGRTAAQATQAFLQGQRGDRRSAATPGPEPGTTSTMPPLRP